MVAVLQDTVDAVIAMFVLSKDVQLQRYRVTDLQIYQAIYVL